MIGRRQFLELLGGAAAASLWRGTPQCSPAARAPRLDRIGLQLYTLRGEMAKDVERTLARVAEIGYRELEFAGYFDRSPAELRAIIDRLGLTAPSSHISLDATGSGFDRVLDAAKTLGHRYLFVGWIPPEQRKSLADYREIARRLDEAGRRATAAGVQFGFHNHDFEFEPIDGRVPYDILLAETDPSRVVMELDLYWITKAGRDPLEYFERHPGRFPAVHVKDAKADAERTMVEVGAGSIDWSRIFAHADEAGIRHYFVEHDNPADPFASIAASYRHLRDLR